MIRYVCDKCGHNNDDFIFKVCVGFTALNKEGDDKGYEHLDPRHFCTQCLGELKQLVKGCDDGS